MSYGIERDEPVQAAVVRITREQARKAIDEIGDQDLDDHTAVHQVRKRCKKIRALYRLTRDAAPDLYARENSAYRDLADELSELRDAQAHLEAYDLLAERFDTSVDDEAFGVIRETLEDRRDDLADELDLDRRLAAARVGFEQGLERLDDVAVDDEGFDALAGGLARTYERARDRLTDAFDERTTAAFHEWRKRVKYHRYHVRLLEAAWPEVLSARREELHDLTDIIGDDHDLAELRHTLRTEPDRFPDGEPVEAFVALLDRQRARLQREAEPLGTKLFSEEPEPFVDRIATYWRQWRTGPVPELADAVAVVRPGD